MVDWEQPVVIQLTIVGSTFLLQRNDNSMPNLVGKQAVASYLFWNSVMNGASRLPNFLTSHVGVRSSWRVLVGAALISFIFWGHVTGAQSFSEWFAIDIHCSGIVTVDLRKLSTLFTKKSVKSSVLCCSAGWSFRPCCLLTYARAAYSFPCSRWSCPCSTGDSCPHARNAWPSVVPSMPAYRHLGVIACSISQKLWCAGDSHNIQRPTMVLTCQFSYAHWLKSSVYLVMTSSHHHTALQDHRLTDAFKRYFTLLDAARSPSKLVYEKLCYDLLVSRCSVSRGRRTFSL